MCAARGLKPTLRLEWRFWVDLQAECVGQINSGERHSESACYFGRSSGIYELDVAGFDVGEVDAEGGEFTHDALDFRPVVAELFGFL